MSTYKNPMDNVGQVGIDISTGDPAIGIGGGLSIDLGNGDLGMQAAPGIDFNF